MKYDPMKNIPSHLKGITKNDVMRFSKIDLRVVALPKEQDAVMMYTDPTGYKAINGFLRNDKLETREQLSSVIANLDSLLAKSTMPSDTIVYRGLEWDMGETAKVGDVWQDLAYQSSSLKAKMATNKKTKSILKIELPQGTQAVYIANMGMPRSEAEVLLPRGTRIIVKSIERNADGVNVITVQVLP